MFETVRLKPFEKELKKIFKRYPKAKKRIIIEIESLSQKVGDRYPGFGEDIHVRKVRIGLPEYKISKSDGLRLICLFIILKEKRIPLVIYLKKSIGKEQDIKRIVIQRLKEINEAL